ncbi:MAG: molybdenum cofactor biosynthesis protein MoaE [Candidatus Omnitrophica bacterium]|nr:molybdenum cofactor biosynthesis protein MoaE [Candidatus Omnitrophota bacterium]
MDFTLSSTSLNPPDLAENFKASGAGAFNGFEGRVRDHNDSKTVVGLEYEAYGPLCQQEAQKIMEEAKVNPGVIDIKIVHRTGRLKVGETAVWVGVLAAHRDEGFTACRYVIDELKKRLPIWKKEYYADGNSGWSSCSCLSGRTGPDPRDRQAIPRSL